MNRERMAADPEGPREVPAGGLRGYTSVRPITVRVPGLDVSGEIRNTVVVKTRDSSLAPDVMASPVPVEAVARGDAAGTTPVPLGVPEKIGRAAGRAGVEFGV
jgi:hypothetical protein